MNTTQAPIDPTTMGMEDPAEVMAARRKQELAMALLKQLQGGAPQPQQTRILAKQSLGNVLMNTAAQSIAGDRVAEADKRMGDIAKQQQGVYSSGVTDLMNAPDKKAAIAKAMASNNPALRALAAAQEKARQDAEEKEAARQADLAKAAAALHGEKGDTAGGLQALATRQINPNAVIPPAPAPQPGLVPGPNGEQLPFNINTNPKSGAQTGSYGSGGVKITNNMPGQQQETEAAKAFGKKSVEVLETTTKSAQSAIGKLQSAERIMDLVKNPAVISGALAEPRLGLAKLGELLGFQGEAAIGQTQGLLSELAAQTLANVGKLPGAITEKERPFLAQAAAGSLDYTPEAISHLARLAQVDSHNQLMYLKKQYDSAAATPGVGENSGMFPFPKGWRFQPDPTTMEETGNNTDLWRVKERNAPSAPGAAPAYKPLNQMTRAEKEAELKRLRGGN